MNTPPSTRPSDAGVVATAFLAPADDSYQVLVMTVHRCTSAEEFADVVQRFGRDHPDGTLRTWSTDSGSAEVATVATQLMRDPRRASGTRSAPGSRSKKEPVLPYLRRIADEQGNRWWTIRELVERCVELGWSSTSHRAGGTVVRRLPDLERMEGYAVSQEGRGRATRWRISHLSEVEST